VQKVSCRACKTETHATTPTGPSIAMVNLPDLLSGTGAITAAMTDQNYSKIFRIVVPDTADAASSSQQLSKELDKEVADLLRSMYEEHVGGEEQAMRAKVDNFKRSQMDAFKKVQAQGTEEELRMFMLLKTMLVLDWDLKPRSGNASPVASVPVLPVLPGSLKKVLPSDPAIVGKGAAGMKGSSGGGADVFDGSDDDDDATFAMDGFSSTGNGSVDPSDSESDNDGDAVVGRVAPTSPTAQAMLGSSLQRSSLPMDIPLSSSRASLPRAMQPPSGSLADIGVGSPYSRDLPRGAIDFKPAAGTHVGGGSSLSTSFQAGSFKGPGAFVGSFNGESAIRARLTSLDMQPRRRSNENALTDGIVPGSPPK
jgi:hypothetical protein